MPPDATTLRRPADLVRAGLVPAARAPALEAVAARYAVAITPAMAGLIDPTDTADPIGLQFLPHESELDHAPGELADPIGDEAYAPVPGIVHRYPDRALLKLVAACPVYCRFCFRRESVGPGEGALTGARLEAALGYIEATPAIWEVVVTGGDPFAASPRRIGEVVARLAAVPHVRVVRFHTRVPVVDPARVTPALVAALRAEGITTWVVLHANHAREVTAEARAALARLADAGVPLLSQSVLLRGINDAPEALEALMRALVEARVKPYYLHHADLAPGTARFRTTIADGQAVVRALRARASGLCQPAYVLDIPGGHGKVPVGPGYLGEDGTVRDHAGRAHEYPPAG